MVFRNALAQITSLNFYLHRSSVNFVLNGNPGAKKVKFPVLKKRPAEALFRTIETILFL